MNKVIRATVGPTRVVAGKAPTAVKSGGLSAVGYPPGVRPMKEGEKTYDEAPPKPRPFK